MEWDIIQGLIDGRLLIVLAACWVIGYVLKSTPKVQDWTIIYIVSGVAIVFSILMLGLSVESVVQGILVGAVAVYGNQLVKQTKKGAGTDASA
ncbi:MULTISPECIES: phage holin family protein [unclassified Paenibacillus]|uniref:phage holin family protein n=1 Tax=unclassified Paenibacillus TaxID=185978 RepID=UPI0004038B2A|nr:MULTISPECIES: phage holin family protein [unclassified Paenibacillus]KGP80074.1 PPE-repeat protein [Paenibacillus sp. MAEPY2]KGP89425.1 PPE-repeat protein [Paenibacillus sp. MAEPY1]